MCYIIPLTIILIINGFKIAKKISIPNFNRLNFLMLGGVTMLVVDHLWNGELLLIGQNIINDLSLGFIMSGVVIIAWKIINLLEKKQALVKVQKTGLDNLDN